MSSLDENRDHWQTPEDIADLIEIISNDRKWLSHEGFDLHHGVIILNQLLLFLQEEDKNPWITRSFLLDYLTEHNIRLADLFEQETLEKLAEVLGINPQELGLT